VTRVRRQRLKERREQLIIDHMPMVAKVAQKVLQMFTQSGQAGYALELELGDLISEGYVGLCKAAMRYRPGLGPFDHYAWFLVRGQMIDATRRRAYKELTHDSVEAIQESLGFIPASISTDPSPLPDETVDQLRNRRKLLDAIALLPETERNMIERYLTGAPLAQSRAERSRSASWAHERLNEAKRQVACHVLGKAVWNDVPIYKKAA